jgi:hypothetical protein
MTDAKSILIRKLALFGYALEAGRREARALNSPEISYPVPYLGTYEYAQCENILAHMARDAEAADPKDSVELARINAASDVMTEILYPATAAVRTVLQSMDRQRFPTYAGSVPRHAAPPSLAIAV